MPQGACECDAQLMAQRPDRVRHVTLSALGCPEGCNPGKWQALAVQPSFFATGIVADFQSLRHQETVRSDAHAGVVVKAPPTPPLIAAQPHVLLEILVITLDAPAHVRGAHQIAQIRGLWQRGQ